MTLTYPPPPVTPPDEKAECSCNCGCSCGGSPTNTTGAAPINPGCADGTAVTAIGSLTDDSSNYGVLYGNGLLRKDATDVKSAGYGAPWAHTRVYNNVNSAFDSGQGTGWLVFRWPYIVPTEDSGIIVVRGTQGTLWLGVVDDKLVPYYAGLSSGTYDPEPDTYTLTLPCGTSYQFYGFTQTTYPQGMFAQISRDSLFEGICSNIS